MLTVFRAVSVLKEEVCEFGRCIVLLCVCAVEHGISASRKERHCDSCVQIDVCVVRCLKR